MNFQLKCRQAFLCSGNAITHPYLEHLYGIFVKSQLNFCFVYKPASIYKHLPLRVEVSIYIHHRVSTKLYIKI